MNALGPYSSIGGSLTWALGVDTYAQLSRKYPPSVVNFSRALVAGPLFVLLFLVQAGWNGTIGADLAAFDGTTFAWLTVSAVGTLALGDLIFMKATTSPLGAAGALAIGSTYPIWSALIGAIKKGEELPSGSVVGLLLVVAGTIGVILASQGRPVRAPGRTLSLGAGAGLAFAASLIWAVNIYALSHVSTVSTALSNVVRMGGALALCPVFGFLLLGVRPSLMERADFRRALPVFVVEAFGGSILYVYGISHSSMAVGAVLSSLAPVFAVPIAIFRHRELASPRKLLAVVVVVLGLWTLILANR